MFECFVESFHRLGAILGSYHCENVCAWPVHARGDSPSCFPVQLLRSSLSNPKLGKFLLHAPAPCAEKKETTTATTGLAVSRAVDLFPVPSAPTNMDSIYYKVHVVDVRWDGYLVSIACFNMPISIIKHAFSTRTLHDISCKHPVRLKWMSFI